MTAAPAAALGIRFRVLALDSGESAAQVVSDVVLGRHDDPDALRALATGASVMTFDHEHVPTDVLRALQSEGVTVRPAADALVHAQDKIAMREALDRAGLPSPQWRVISSPDEIESVGNALGWPLILKVSRGGYDGRGVWRVDDAKQVRQIMEDTPLVTGARWLAEECVPFTRELAAQVARSPHGQAVAYPIVRTVQVDGMCSEVVAPCPGLDEDRALQAQRIALEIAGALDVTGMLAVELFDTPGGVLVNELAMRPHNSGHWTIEGAVTSQFENHLRAVLDLPLGDPGAVAPWSVMVNIVGPADSATVPPLHEAYRHVLARDPGLKVHLYGKDMRPGRKLGHVTVVGEDLEDLLARAHHAADYFMGVIND